MKRFIVSTVVIVGSVFAAATVYDVELSFNDNDSSFTPQRQTFLATADSISEVAFFCGRKIVPGSYKFRITDANGGALPGDPTAYSDSSGLFEHELVFATFDPKVYVRKGSKYSLVVAHTDTFKVNFYYNRSENAKIPKFQNA